MPSCLYISLKDEGVIAIFHMDITSGELTPIRHVRTGTGVMPLAIDPAGRFLHAGLRTHPTVRSYRLSDSGDDLHEVGETPLGWDPTYLATDRTGRFLLSASYLGAVAGVHAIGTDGVVVPTSRSQYAMTRGAHCIRTDPSNRFAFVPHVAESNAIYGFRFNSVTGSLTPKNSTTVIPPLGTGPRHYCHHPSAPFVYVDNEQGCSVTAYHFDAAYGTLNPLQTITTLPSEFDSTNTCAQMHLHPSGRFLYVSNRGHDSIAGFAVDTGTGRLRPIGHAPAPGTPRAFNIDSSGRFLYAAGQDSGTVTAFQINSATGILEPFAAYEVGAAPSWVEVVGE